MKAKAHPIDTAQWVPVEKVRENAYNPNRQLPSARAMLIDSIETFGWTLPIVVGRPNDEGYYEVVDGAHRLQAARSLHMYSVPVVVLDVDRAGRIEATMTARGLSISTTNTCP